MKEFILGQQSNHVCNALALLQCVASHPETRSAFLQAHIPYFLYPFLHTVSKSRPFEYLGLTSLGVVGALVKGKMVNTLGKEPSVRLQKHVVRCCLQLSDNTRAREALRQCLPDQLKDATLSMYLKDENTKKWLSQLMQNLSETV